MNDIQITQEGYTNEHPFLVISVSRDSDIPTILNRSVSSVIMIKSSDLTLFPRPYVLSTMFYFSITNLSRCVMIQFIVEIWEQCGSRDQLCAAKFEGITPLPGTFNILLHSFGRKVAMQEKIDLIEKIEYLPLT